MQKWCPEPLEPPAGARPSLASLTPPWSTPASWQASSFRPESGFSSSEALLSSLSREERVQVAKLLEDDLRKEYERRRLEEEASRKKEADAAAARMAAWQDSLSQQLQQAFRSALSMLASRISECALIMAAKVVRKQVEQDPEVLVRSLETVLYKAEPGCSLSVTVHPDDAVWLAADPEIRQRLRIRDMKEDRRVERGGCLVEIDEAEWDATISRQLSTLCENLAAVLSVPPEPGEGAVDDRPQLG